MSPSSNNDNSVSFASRLMEAERMEGLSSDEDAVYRFIAGIATERKEQVAESFLEDMNVKKRVQILSEVLDYDDVGIVAPVKLKNKTTPKSSPQATSPTKRLFSFPTVLKSRAPLKHITIPKVSQ